MLKHVVRRSRSSLAKPWLRRLAVELVLWFSIPAAFLAVYVGHFGVAPSAILPHLRLVFGVFCALAVCRVALAASVANDTALRAAQSAIASAFLGAMSIYYALVLVGMHAWGRVITWDLMATYTAQAAPFAEALGISLWPVVAGLAAAYLALLAMAWIYFARADWTRLLANATSRSLLVRVLVYGSAFCAVELASFVLAPPAAKLEPLSLTFFPEKGAREIQHHAVDPLRAETLDRLENRARAAYRADPAARRRNVVLIVADALRPDHMSVYGYQRDTTPNLSLLAPEDRLRRAPTVYATCSNSACGVLSLITSKYIHQFSSRPFTLQEALRKHGYRIHMILAGDHVNYYAMKEQYGAVDSYFDGSMARGYANDDRIVIDRVAALPAWDGVPVLLQFHLMSVHVIGKRQERFVKYRPSRSYSLYPAHGGGESAVNYYDNGVVQADAVIGELLAILRRKGYLDDALIVVTADHGEALGERGLYAHANGVDEEVLRIPLIVIGAGFQPRPWSNENGIASQVDIAPTILAELGMPRPATWSGSPLQEKRAASYVFFQDRQAVGFVDHRDPNSVWKYWMNSATGKEHAFDLTTDRTAHANVIDAVPESRKRQWRFELLEMMPGGTGVMGGSEPLPAEAR